MCSVHRDDLNSVSSLSIYIFLFHFPNFSFSSLAAIASAALTTHRIASMCLVYYLPNDTQQQYNDTKKVTIRRKHKIAHILSCSLAAFYAQFEQTERSESRKSPVAICIAPNRLRLNTRRIVLNSLYINIYMYILCIRWRCIFKYIHMYLVFGTQISESI